LFPPRAFAETPGAQTPSTIANVDVSSDDGSETLGGLSKVESFGDDPSVEIMRLKALLRQREEELAEKSKLLSQREGLLRQSKGAPDPRRRPPCGCPRPHCVWFVQKSSTGSSRRTTA